MFLRVAIVLDILLINQDVDSGEVGGETVQSWGRGLLGEAVCSLGSDKTYCILNDITT